MVHPIGTSLYNEYTAELLIPLAAPSTKIEVRNLERLGDEPFVFSSDSVSDHLLQEVRDAEEDGVDGVILACASDPGVKEIRSSVSIPVVGPFGALANLGDDLGRLGIIAAKYKIDTWGPRAAEHGLGENLVCVRISDIVHPSDDLSSELLAEDPQLLLSHIINEMRRSIDEEAVPQSRDAAFFDQVDTLFFACTLWAGLLDPVRDAVPDVKVLDPLVSPLRYMEYLVGV